MALAVSSTKCIVHSVVQISDASAWIPMFPLKYLALCRRIIIAGVALIEASYASRGPTHASSSPSLLADR